MHAKLTTIESYILNVLDYKMIVTRSEWNVYVKALKLLNKIDISSPGYTADI